MLILKRNLYFNQLEKCDVSGELIYPGDYYYEDDQDGVKVKATVYKELQLREKEDTWDYSKLNMAENEIEYRRNYRELTRQMLQSNILRRKITGKLNNNEEDEEVQNLYDMKKNKNNFFINNGETQEDESEPTEGEDI